MAKVGHFLLFFVLIIFVATSGIVISPSLYKTKVTNNFEKVFATIDNDDEECAEDEVFNEETQLCEAITDNEEDKGTDEDQNQQEQQQSQQCADGETFNEETQTCEPFNVTIWNTINKFHIAKS